MAAAPKTPVRSAISGLPLWECKNCESNNNLKREKCFRCGRARYESPKLIMCKSPPQEIPDIWDSIPVLTVRQTHHEEANDLWKDIVKHCRELRQNFIDDSFPPIPRSLYFAPTDEKNRKKYVQWLRPEQIRMTTEDSRHKRWTVFDSPSPFDLCQGYLGDCWFISALAVIAEKKELIKNILITKDYCPEGVYKLRLCKDGMWTTVIVDDVFPCDEHDRFMYSEAKRKQLWVPLIEKALAKLHGCYEAIVGGQVHEGLAILTGASCDYMELQGQRDVLNTQRKEDKGLVWAKLLSCRESGFLLGASCGANSMEEVNYENVGLLNNHAYSILDVRMVNKIRLLKLRNPWGRHSWNGDWSEKSEKWRTVPEDERMELLDIGGEEGVFWMSLDDLMLFFDTVSICKYRPDWMETRLQATLPCRGQPTATKVEVFRRTEIDIDLFQTSKRDKNHNHSLVDMCIVVLESEKGSKKYTGRVISYNYRTMKGTVSINQMLDAGEYIVVVLAFNHWSIPDSAAVDFVFSIHTAYAAVVTREDLPNSVLADTIIQLAMQKGSQSFQNNDMTVFELSVNQEVPGLFLVVENSSQDKYILFKADCRKSKNVVSTRGTLLTCDVVPPMHRMVVIALSRLSEAESLQIGEHMESMICPYDTLRDWCPRNPDAKSDPEITKDIRGLHAPRPIT